MILKKLEKWVFEQKNVAFCYIQTPYFQPKSKCVINESEWLETHFEHVFEKCYEDHS